MKGPIGLLNIAMNAEPDMWDEKDLADIENLGLGNIEDTLSPSDDYIREAAQNDVVRKGAGLLAGTYGTAFTLKHGLRHLTPITRRLAAPMIHASTTIPGYYNPKEVARAGAIPSPFSAKTPLIGRFHQSGGGFDWDPTGKVQAKVGRLNLLRKHWLAGDNPGLEKYIETIEKDTGKKVTKDEVRKFLKSSKSQMFGLGAAGVETSDELLQAEIMERAQEKVNRYRDIDERGKFFSEEERLKNQKKLTKWRKARTRARNQLRYEMQKTELIKHSFGIPINKDRWKQSGLGPIKKTTLLRAVDGNQRVANAWKKDSLLRKTLKKVGNISDKTPMTVSQYTGADKNLLIRNAKNYGSTYLKSGIDYDLGREFGIKPRQRVGGIFDLTKDVHRLYEYGIYEKGLDKKQAFKKYVVPYLDNIKNNVQGNEGTVRKATEMLERLKKGVDHVDGRTKVNYSLVSNQQTVAGVNADIEIWRGAEGRSATSATQQHQAKKIAKELGLPEPKFHPKRALGSKMHHRIMVTDIYDVAGGAGSITQKNLHMNIAHQDSRPGKANIKFEGRGLSRKEFRKSLQRRDYKAALKLVPGLTRKSFWRMVTLLALRR